ncbi:Glucosamine-phosphate N-acetyltransferase-like protein [Coelomomyces lativittatus]|nr:Glucosamine-phosphate N-acetyltransferase-like protein [Coelomomyces lativittatus]
MDPQMKLSSTKKKKLNETRKIELIDPSVHKELPLGYSLRPLALQDISKGYLNVLQQLTTVGSVDQTNFENRFRKLESSGNAYFPIVIEKNQGNIVAAGTLLIEYKFIHECGCVRF